MTDPKLDAVLAWTLTGDNRNRVLARARRYWNDREKGNPAFTRVQFDVAVLDPFNHESLSIVCAIAARDLYEEWELTGL